MNSLAEQEKKIETLLAATTSQPESFGALSQEVIAMVHRVKQIKDLDKLVSLLDKFACRAVIEKRPVAVRFFRDMRNLIWKQSKELVIGEISKTGQHQKALDYEEMGGKIQRLSWFRDEMSDLLGFDAYRPNEEFSSAVLRFGETMSERADPSIILQSLLKATPKLLTELTELFPETANVIRNGLRAMLVAEAAASGDVEITKAVALLRKLPDHMQKFVASPEELKNAILLENDSKKSSKAG